MFSRRTMIGLFVVICLGISFAVFQQHRQNALSNQHIVSPELNFSSLTGTWAGSWKAEHYGTLSIKFSPSGSYDGKLLGTDVPERGHLAGNVEKTGSVLGTYNSPALGACTLAGQFYVSGAHHLTGYLIVYSAPKIQKDRITIDLTK